MEGSVGAGAEEFAFIAAGAKRAQLCPVMLMLYNETRKDFFSRGTRKKLLLSWCNATGSSNKVLSPKIQDKLCGAYAYVSHFSDFLAFTDTRGFVSAAGSRSHAGTWAVSLRYSLLQPYFKVSYSQALQLPEIHIWVLWKAPAGIC